jgi:hypothetical protein
MQMTRLTFVLGFGACIALTIGIAGSTPLAAQESKVAERAASRTIADEDFWSPYKSLAKEWEEDVQRISASNSTDGSSDHVLFLGSSSFRLWDSVAEDMAPYPIVRRAFGGAKYRDLAIYTPTCVQGLRFGKAMVFIANDIRGKEDDNDPKTVARFANVVLCALQREQPQAEIYLIAVTPTAARFSYWSAIQQINSELESIADSRPGVHFVATADAFLNAEGNPKSELFQEDRLHLNREGYQQWARLLKDALAKSPAP